MKNLISAMTILFATVLQGEQAGSVIPTGEITKDTTSIETAYPGQVYVSRKLEEGAGVVSYEIRFFDEELIRNGFTPKLCDVVLVVKNRDGVQLLSAPIELSGVSEIPPSKHQFRVIRFAIHKSLEDRCVLSLGRHHGMRVLYTGYSLPLKSIPHQKAEQDGAE